MSIPEYSSYSTITSSSDNTSTIVNTKSGTNNKYKLNNRFDSHSASENSKFNNMRRTKASKKSTIQYYTINNTTDSNSITSTSKNTNNSINSDMSYHPSTNDDNTSYSLNKINEDHRNQRKPIKYIQQNFYTLIQIIIIIIIIIPTAHLQLQKFKIANSAKKRK